MLKALMINQKYPSALFMQKRWYLNGQYSVIELILIILEIIKFET